MKGKAPTGVSARRVAEENRPKNGGVHSDQLRRVHTRGNRRRGKQELRREWR